MSCEARKMKKLEELGLGTHQVEQQAWKLQAAREEKKGSTKLAKMKKGFYEKTSQRDKEYVKAEMEIRAKQVRQD